MKILVLVFHFPPISGGGVVVITDIINKFAELGNDVTVITPNLDWNGEQFNPKINPKIKIVRTETPSKNKIKVAARRCQSNMKKKSIEIGKSDAFDFIFTIFHPFHLVPKAAVETAKILNIPSIVKVDDAIFEKAKGTGIKTPSPCEEKNLQANRVSIIAMKDIPAGKIISEDMIDVRRPGTGLPPKYYEKIIGKKAKINISSETALTWKMID